jgi:polyisoprenoid-binding protein YceI
MAANDCSLHRPAFDNDKSSTKVLMMKLSMRLSALCCCLWLLSCTQPTQQAATPPTTPVATDYPSDLHGAKLYRISPEQSMLHILVYRGGAMANLGHNHVISSHSIAGYVWVHDDLSHSGFDLTQAVNDLIVDDPQTRSDEGTDFQTTVTDSARAGTRTNMLKPEQLDGEHFSLIRLRSVSITGTRERPEVKVRITIKDQSREVVLPTQLVIDRQSLQVKGQFKIKLTEFGITPYSVAMGALKVEDELTIKFELVAKPLSP